MRAMGGWEFDLLPPLFVGKGGKGALGIDQLSVGVWVKVEVG